MIQMDKGFVGFVVDPFYAGQSLQQVLAPSAYNSASDR